MKRGLVLFAHGARDARWAEPFEAVARRVSALDPELDVRLAFLEFMDPALPEACRALVESGCDSVEIVPLFLGAGGHVRRDLPALVASLVAVHPAIRWTLRAAIGEDDRVIEAMARAAVDSQTAPKPAQEPTAP